MNKLLLTCTAVLCLSACQQRATEGTYADYPIQSVNLNHVTLTDQFWYPRIETVQKRAIAYAFSKCEEEGRFANFVTAGKVIQGGKGEYIGVMPFDDTDVYKIIEGAAYSLISAPDPALDAYLDSIIAIVAQGQEPDGYLTTWRTIAPTQSPCDWVKPGPRWSDLSSSHELYNAGHLYEAAAAHYHATGKRNFLDIALKNADLIVEVFGDPDYYAVPGHQIIETGLVKLYHITGNEKYLLLSKRLLDLRGDGTHRTLYTDYNQDHVPVVEQDEAVGHAVRAVYMYAGMADIATMFDDADYRQASHALFDNVLHKKMYVTGGLGARHEGEAFGANYELPNLTAYSETCAAIAGVYWYDRLFRMTGDARYYDILERTLYNALLVGISLEGTEYFYPCALESDGEYRFNRGHCTRAPWFDCSCCPSNLMRFIPYVPNLIYATEGDNLYVNLFVANEARVPMNDKEVRVTQETHYPWDGAIRMKISAPDMQAMTLKIRIPQWLEQEGLGSELYRYNPTPQSAEARAWTVRLNGETIDATREKGYLCINRTWSDDVLEIDFPMEVRQIVADARVQSEHGAGGEQLAIARGPLIYCMEEIDNPTFDRAAIAADTRFEVVAAPALLNGVNTLVSGDRAEKLTLIPYYAWSNRGVNKMRVWLPADK